MMKRREKNRFNVTLLIEYPPHIYSIIDIPIYGIVVVKLEIKLLLLGMIFDLGEYTS